MKNKNYSAVASFKKRVAEQKAHFNFKQLAVYGFLLAVAHVAFTIIFSDTLMVGACDVTLASFLGSIPASSAGSFTTTYVPQFIGFTAATVPTNFQIEVNGEPMIMSLDGAGLGAMTHIRQEARVANTYVFQLADGLMNSKNTIFTITNAVASTLNIYGWSPIKQGNNYFEYTRLSVLAGATTEISDFAYLGFPSAAATDRFQVAYNDGSVDSLIRDELNYNLGYYQGDLTSKYNIDNINPARITRVFFTPVGAQTAYKMSYRPA